MDTSQIETNATLNDEAVARLKQINVQLNVFQRRIHEIAKVYRRQITQAAIDLGLPVNDIVIEAELDYSLNTTDPRYDPTFENSENLVGSRILCRPDSADRLDFDIDEPGSVIGPQGWLFHDLTDHSYGVNQPEVPQAELLNIEKVYVNVVITHGVEFNLSASIDK